MTTNTGTRRFTVTHLQGPSRQFVENATGRTVTFVGSMLTVPNSPDAAFLVTLDEGTGERTQEMVRFSIPVTASTRWSGGQFTALAARLLDADPATLPRDMTERRGFDFLEDPREPCSCGDCDGWHWATP